MKITEKQLRKRIEGWQAELEALGIGTWRLDALEIVASDEFWASVLPNGLYDRYKLRFDTEFLEECDEQELDETIVHELLHVVMRDLDQATERAIIYAPGGDNGEVSTSIRRAREALVHRLSVHIVASYYGE